MGYSLDNSTDTTYVHDTSLDAKVAAGTGSHTLHVKAWGDKGALCVTDVTVKIETDASVEETTGIPSYATSVSSLQALSSWRAIHDARTPGSATGKTSIVGSPSRTGKTRAFVTSYKDSGGERYEASFGDDASATNFLYDAWVYVTDSIKYVANLEMDLNQVMSNGQTVIYGVQCDGYSHTWDYTHNLGTAAHPKGHWTHTSRSCRLQDWKKNAWHHIQIGYSRTDTGRVTYKAVWLDGVKETIDATVFSAHDLGWSPTLLTNFQIDGAGGSGKSTIYLDDLTIYRW